MIVLAATLLAMQAVTPAPSPPPTLACHLASPVNEVIAFAIVPSEGETAILVGLAGSVWPRREIMVTKRPIVAQSGRTIEAYDIGTGTNPQRIILPGTGHIIIYLTEGGELALPAAAGYCDETNAPPAQPVSTERPVNPFDPNRWPDDCGFITRDGIRGRMTYDIMLHPRGRNNLRIGDPSNSIWTAQEMRLQLQFISRVGSHISGQFRGLLNGSEPSGIESFFSFGGRATKLIEFSTLGTQSRLTEQNAIAICGYSGIIARATQE
ncbi:MAG: hypothetical protein ABL882_00310 [Sphingopyxis sp.]